MSERRDGHSWLVWDKRARELKTVDPHPHDGSPPKSKGYWWAIWTSKADGTTDPDDPPGPLPEIVYVFENCLDQASDEYLAVHVGGVETTQWLENFKWLRPVNDKAPAIEPTDPSLTSPDTMGIPE